MDLHVAQQAAPVEKSFATLRANVRAVFLVGALVRRECGTVGKAFPAAAGVRSFSVGLEVLAEVADRAENQLAVRAFAGSRRRVRLLAVRLYVPHQCGLPRERPAAFRAQVLAVLHVGAAVLLQSRQRLEDLAAYGAVIVAAGVVRQLVPFQRLFEGEPAAALRTEEGLLARVDTLVRFKVGPKPEALLTARTAKTSFSIRDGQIFVLGLRVDLGIIPGDPHFLRGVERTLLAGQSS